MISVFQIKLAAQLNPIIIKKSKFIASTAPITSEKDAKEFIEKIRFKEKKANHNCFAYRLLDLNTNEIILNESDDGEPSGTAGNSILYVMEKQNIVNSIIVVSRYFGGIKLGKGGLTRAYSNSASEIIKNIGLKQIC